MCHSYKKEKTVSTIELSIQEKFAIYVLISKPRIESIRAVKSWTLDKRLQIYSITGELVQSINEPSKPSI